MSREETESASGYLEKILSNNSQDLMIAFKRIPPGENAPSFKTLKNNSVIDNTLFLRQKMVKADSGRRDVGLLEGNNHQMTKDRVSDGRDMSSYSRHNISSSGRNPRNLNSSLNINGNDSVSTKRGGMDLSNICSKNSLMKTMSKSSQRKNMSQKKLVDRSRQSLEEEERGPGWKLVTAKLKEGKIVCETPALDLKSGELKLYKKNSILEKIRDNKYNTGGKKVLDEVSQWLQNQTYLKNAKGNHWKRAGVWYINWGTSDI